MKNCTIGLAAAAGLALTGTALGQTFSGGGAMIPGGGFTSGPSDPYPLGIGVAGVGLVSQMTVTLEGLSHTWPDDMDFLLVGPSGQSVILMSDAGGSAELVGFDLIFDDAAADILPDNPTDPWPAGTYRPTNYGDGDVWDAPAPAGPYGATLSVFTGTSADGTWNLYIDDDTGSDAGSMVGWSITFVPAPGAAALLGLGGLVAVRRRR